LERTRQWLVQRGFAVLQPNYRGSTATAGVAQSLSGRWGERDVADVAAGIRYAMKDSASIRRAG
jgi:dipeptidyl aminopeptidase/acylaminoacyl peptidase